MGSECENNFLDAVNAEKCVHWKMEKRNNTNFKCQLKCYQENAYFTEIIIMTIPKEYASIFYLKLFFEIG